MVASVTTGGRANKKPPASAGGCCHVKATWMGQSTFSVDGSLLGHVLESLEGAHLDDLAGGLGLEHDLFLGERINSLACLGGRLLDDHDLHQSGHSEDASALLADGIADFLRERIEDGLHLLARKLGGVGDVVDDFTL